MPQASGGRCGSVAGLLNISPDFLSKRKTKNTDKETNCKPPNT